MDGRGQVTVFGVILHVLLGVVVVLTVDFVGGEITPPNLRREGLFWNVHQAGELVMIGTIGYLTGRLLYFVSPAFVSMSRWLAVPFAALFLVSFCSDLAEFGLRTAISTVLWWERPGVDEPSVIIILITYPMLFYGCIWLGARKARRCGERAVGDAAKGDGGGNARRAKGEGESQN
jgi:hypothetical protein